MASPDNILFNDRALIKILRSVMSGRTDDLYAPLESLLIRAGASEGREE